MLGSELDTILQLAFCLSSWTAVLQLVFLLQFPRTSQSLDYGDRNIITPKQRRKVNNRTLPTMFTMKKDRKVTRVSSPKLALPISTS